MPSLADVGSPSTFKRKSEVSEDLASGLRPPFSASTKAPCQLPDQNYGDASENNDPGHGADRDLSDLNVQYLLNAHGSPS